MKAIMQKYKNIPIQVKASIWYTICNILQKGISVITIPIYTRILTEKQYGAYSVYLSWLEIFEIVATFRLAWGGFVVGLTKYEKERDSYSSSMQCLSILITSVFLVIYLLFTEYINRLTNMSTSVTLLLFALLYAMPALSFWTARKRVEYHYQAVLIVTLISSFLMPALGVVAALVSVKKDVAIIAARVVVQGIIGIVLIWINCHKKFTFYHSEYWKRALQFNVPLLPYYLSMVVLHSSDRIIIKDIVGEAEAGIYSVASTISIAMQLFSSSINSALQPWLFQRLKDKEYNGIGEIINITLAIMALLNLALVAFAPEVIAFMAPKSYQGAIWIVPPLAASVFIMFFYQHFVNIEFYFEESKMIAVASIGAAILNVSLNYALIPKYGYLAAGYTTLCSYVVFCIGHYIFMRIICKKNACPVDLVNIRLMSLILIVFFVFIAILMMGYFVPVIRIIVIVSMVIVVVVKRKMILQVVGQLIKNKK